MASSRRFHESPEQARELPPVVLRPAAHRRTEDLAPEAVDLVGLRAAEIGELQGAAAAGDRGRPVIAGGRWP
ncbi:hypothetical protein ACQPYK_47330 [Streptosporangium sp. CA-135522]|uniref:hypothetical protein n=1 Tax=Streptosporangium sp. CA-135522 TaxID=3240072 RepID=UPI003D89D32D